MMSEGLAEHYRSVRGYTLALVEPLSDEDCCVQSMPDASPIKWHLAHASWFFETFILERFEPRFRPFDASFRVLFNSYYNGVGDKYPRPRRGLLTRPSLGEVRAYRRNVDERILQMLMRHDVPAELAGLVELGLQHEQQHQELMLTDVKHLLSMNPTNPAYSKSPLSLAARIAPAAWHAFESGIVEVGHSGNGFCFDNEMPRHRQYVESFELASRLVSNGEFLAFIDAGGYRDPALWLSEGWDWINANRIAHPLYWRPVQDGWREFTLHGLQPLDPQRPVTHVSYFEADAYARWAGARLPSEAEWESLARVARDAKDFGHASLHPPAADGARQGGLTQLFGACWQWTSSSYAAYPGYRPAEGTIGEYNGKFMVNQYVLRGSSCATPPGHARTTYRNFFPAGARWQFTGIRLARFCGALQR